MKTRNRKSKWKREEKVECIIIAGVALELSLPFIVFLMHL